MRLESPFMSKLLNPGFIRLMFSGSLVMIFASSLLTAGCGENDVDDDAAALPTATPGTMAATSTPTIIQSEQTGALQVGFNVGMQGQPQQGAGVLRQVGRGTHIEVKVRPASGAIQQVSIREGRCESIGRWVESLEAAIGGVSIAEMDELHIRDLVDGNHLIALSVPGGTLSQIAACGNLPDLSHLELPDEAPRATPSAR